ncbi:MAG: ATP-binding protein [Pseudomonadota bacterium]
MGFMRRIRRNWRLATRFVARRMPKGLFGRSLIIIIAPMLLLQAIIAFVFMERHWQEVTDRLSASVVRDLAGVVDIIETYPQDAEFETITRIAGERLRLRIAILPDAELPPPQPKPFFSILDNALSEQLTEQIDKPFWIDTVGDSDLLEIRIRLEEGVLRAFVRRNQAYASNTHIFLLWMVGASVVLIMIAILFLRNQIRPIQRLAEAVEQFGKGQSLDSELRPRGATEVRRATFSFLLMRDRIERALDQRTAMLAGVSHDLRTVLTRFRLQLALVPPSNETDALSHDVEEMQSMLQGYLDFARGDAGEQTGEVELNSLLERLAQEAETLEKSFTFHITGNSVIQVRPVAFNRLLSNLVSNAFRYARSVEIVANHLGKSLLITIDDDGPGIAEEHREHVFKPFVRLDEARNQNDSGTGLGLAIARDIAHTHGGEITLHDSPLGGLRVKLRLPV